MSWGSLAIEIGSDYETSCWCPWLSPSVVKNLTAPPLPETATLQGFSFFFSVISCSSMSILPTTPQSFAEHLSRMGQSVGVPTSLWQPHSRSLCSPACSVVHRCIMAITWLRLYLLFQVTAISLPPTAADVPSDQHLKRGDDATFTF